MKVFLSWSGDLSHKVALELREWIPFVIQSVEPYVSSEDIDKGSRWSIDIAKELEDSSFGILCVTPQNIDAPWLNFEAGALSKAFTTSNVSPFLFGLKPSDLKKSPLLQFQSTLYDKKDLLKLVLSINNALVKEKLDESKLKTTFDVWYEQLKSKLDPLLKDADNKSGLKAEDKTQNNSSDAVEEILELTREQFKILRNPEMILPPDYITHLLKEINQNNPVDFRVVRDLEMGLRKLKIVISSLPEEITFENKELDMALNRLDRAIIFLMENHRRNRNRGLFIE
ncbi:hypothetical protein A5893_15435 [Pedobacter psychrophilus]|uniref:Uncharacterized protein n=1 Tax=Pedobacter psychrophilus TaxID=1826909 RepID=A0A179DCD6_9SPHI|nr:TIR domain-containing protein [Pedobacter psychrophilus]OAQ38189.1 hypothetical protein A5893_15435 [Pedobacter psychrophilus]